MSSAWRDYQAGLHTETLACRAAGCKTAARIIDGSSGFCGEHEGQQEQPGPAEPDTAEPPRPAPELRPEPGADRVDVLIRKALSS